MDVFTLESQVHGRTATYAKRLRALIHDGSPDAVHDYRVATRRLMEVLRLIDQVDPGNDDVRRLLALAPPSAKVLSRVRTADVGLELLAALEVAVPRDDYLVHWGIATVRRSLRYSRKNDFLLAGWTLAGLRPDLLASVSRIARTRSSLPGHEVTAVARDQVADNLARVTALMPALTTPEPDERDLHTLRLAIKSLRYALELLPPETKRGKALKLLKRFQNGLGLHRDWWALGKLSANLGQRRLQRRDADIAAGLEALSSAAHHRAESLLETARRLVPRFDPDSF